MAFPVVALVGRPNVGKSSLLNRMARRRVSIVEPTPGVTRDRVTALVEHGDRSFRVMDTGGIGLFDDVLLKEEVERQIQAAFLEADLLLFLVDAREGLTPMDQEVASLLRKSKKPVLLVGNKAESPSARMEAGAFMKLGFGEPFLVSALEGFGVPELLDRVVGLLPPEGEERASLEPLMKIAVLGKRNAGKSSLINHLAGEERVIVSELPGTTRDAVDVLFERGGRRILAIDTAGLRKRRSVQDAVEFFSMKRAEKAALRADVALLLFDLSRPISRVDQSLARFLLDHYKPVVIAGTKWDLAKDRTGPADWEEYIRTKLAGLSFAPITFFSVKEGFHVEETLELCWELFSQSRTRVGTGELNRVLREAMDTVSPRAKRGARAPRIFYATQPEVGPPTIVLFVNDPTLFSKDYLRFLQNRLRRDLPFKEVPVRILLRPREKVELPSQGQKEGGRRERKRKS